MNNAATFTARTPHCFDFDMGGCAADVEKAAEWHRREGAVYRLVLHSQGRRGVRRIHVHHGWLLLSIPGIPVGNWIRHGEWWRSPAWSCPPWTPTITCFTQLRDHFQQHNYYWTMGCIFCSGEWTAQSMLRKAIVAATMYIHCECSFEVIMLLFIKARQERVPRRTRGFVHAIINIKKSMELLQETLHWKKNYWKRRSESC